MLRNKKGVHNSYCSPDSINQFDWTHLQQYPQVFEYYRNLIQLRKNHPAFRLSTAARVVHHLEFLPGSDCLVAFRLKDLDGIDSWKEIIVVLNANTRPQTLTIPAGTYSVACCNGVISEAGIGMPIEGGQVSVDGQSAMILYKK